MDAPGLKNGTDGFTMRHTPHVGLQSYGNGEEKIIGGTVACLFRIYL